VRTPRTHSVDCVLASGASCVTANIIDFTTLGDGTLRVMAKGLARTAMLHLAEGKTLTAEVAAIKESSGQEEEASSLIRTVLERFHLYRKLSIAMRRAWEFPVRPIARIGCCVPPQPLLS
jgi:ATP-dependent Lon protease